MSDLDRNYASPFGRAAGRVDAATVDAGLRAYMLRIYNYMSIGLAITGLAALGIYMAAVTTDPSGAAAKIGSAFLTPFGYAMFVSPLKWLFILAPLAMVFVISAGINRLAPSTAQMLFWVFSALMGVSLSSIFLVYTHTSIVRVFFITAATFGALSLYGYTTKRDMTRNGIVPDHGPVRHHHREPGEHLPGKLDVAVRGFGDRRPGVRRPHRLGYPAAEERLHLRLRHAGGDVAERAAITGALSLYLNFINLFTLLLQLLGQRD